MRKVGFSLQLAPQHGHQGKKQQNWVLPLLPAALLFIKAGILSASPSLFLCCAGLYPHPPLHDSLPVSLWLLLFFLVTNSSSSHSLDGKSLPPASCPATGKDLFFLRGGGTTQPPNISSAALFCFVFLFFSSAYLFPWLLFVISLQMGLV